jgi:hypothetical protein
MQMGLNNFSASDAINNLDILFLKVLLNMSQMNLGKQLFFYCSLIYSSASIYPCTPFPIIDLLQISEIKFIFLNSSL